MDAAMFDSRRRIQAALGALLLLPLGTLTGCSSEGGIRTGDYSDDDTSGPSAGPSGGTTDASTSGSGGSSSSTDGGSSGSNVTSGGGGTSSVPLPDGTDPVALIPARI